MTLLMDDREATGEAAAPEGEAAARVIVAYAEEYRCPACDSILPPACVRREDPTTDQLRAGQRTIGVYCPHCNQAWEGLFRLGDGLLHAVAVTRLDPPEVDRLRLRYEQFRGTVSRPARPPAADPALERERRDLAARIAATERALDGLRLAERDLARRAAGRTPPPAGAVGHAGVLHDNGKDYDLTARPPATALTAMVPVVAVPTAEQIAAQRDELDREFDQRNEWTESEPGRDYAE